MHCNLVSWLIVLICLALLPYNSKALEPVEILVIVNSNVKSSLELAAYYMAKRKIPLENVAKLQVAENENIARMEYIVKIAIPVRKYVNQIDLKNQKIRCLVIMYGLPLRIVDSETGGRTKSTNQTNEVLADKNASLDSELALVLLEEHYPPGGWIPNPYFLGFKGQKLDIEKEKVLMVSRLDGPTPQIVKRIIDDSIFAETYGIRGKAYFDARWHDPGNDKKLSGYAYYDRSIHHAANHVKQNTNLSVFLDDRQELFGEASCPNAALYCGWYSLAKYIDAFTWQRGAIGYHIASSECTTLKKPGSQVWCKMMLEKGVAATIGPVGEPYVQSFTVPDIFFGYLVQGYLTLVECYMISTPYLSWKMVLIGDPLYFPFKKIR